MRSKGLLERHRQSVSVKEMESLTDKQILALCDMQMSQEQQRELGKLLARNREGERDLSKLIRLVFQFRGLVLPIRPPKSKRDT